ncbi:glycosyltransferase family 2 protein [Acidovorax sp. sic0104]|uniref:glycosyltransferase family 2 protein n=1 Tax=Acidovorax sp. sic0104 TaxID=2854784 RepID=UPI001C465E5D|nr:glycosyltransferase family 2 protein [Acidovorax sp. sic0104]MBV7539617.1 glycosyltransferase family 2 protein [Acidovorax sp. sic0104]
MPQDRDLNPLISVIVPCRNERQHIDAFCDSALRQVLPEGWRMEVLVADGASDDGTRERLQERCTADARLVLVDNPGRIVSTGLNACIAKARGQIIARLDVHSQFAPDYLAQCIQALERTGADNVGGPWVARGIGPTGAAVAAAFQCRWVVGGARSRDVQFEGTVDTVYLGCWPRSVFERFGQFDEALVRNQDDEHNLRLRLAGARIWQSRLIRSTYHPRGSLRHLFSQQRQYGYWRPFVMRKHGQPGALRQLVPAIFVAAACASIALLPWTAFPFAGLALAYFSYLMGASAAAARAAGDWFLLPRLPATIAAFHVGYGLGTWRGLWDIARSREPSADFARITR